MEPQDILHNLFDEKILSILEFFLKHDEGQYYLREIARKSHVSAASTYRILNKLVDLEILHVKEIKTAKLYTLADNKQVDFLKSILEVDKVDYFVERASKLDGVQEILQLGKKSKNKVNLLMFGEEIDMAQVKLLVAEVKEKYDFTINQMVLSREQYEQMSQMGLYPGKKKSLFRKS